MNRIWAPWRMVYIKSSNAINDSCLFCTIVNQKKDSENLILYRGQFSFIMLNKYPYTNGHIMVVPNRHTANFSDFTNEEHLEMASLINASIFALQECCHPHGFNFGMNLGNVAGAGIADHLHQHIVPRWLGDTNFMPVISNTRVISQSLDEMYSHLLQILQKFFAIR